MTIATRSSVVDAVTAVDSTFGTVFEQIDSWRAAIERHVGAHHGAVTVAELDEVVEALVVPKGLVVLPTRLVIFSVRYLVVDVAAAAVVGRCTVATTLATPWR